MPFALGFPMTALVTGSRTGEEEFLPVLPTALQSQEPRCGTKGIMAGTQAGPLSPYLVIAPSPWILARSDKSGCQKTEYFGVVKQLIFEELLEQK